jgi:hypothetical protein
MHDGPIAFSDVVSGQLRMPCDAPPGEEHAQMFRAQVGSHSSQLAHETDLSLTHFRDRVAEIVIGGDGVDLNSFAVRHGPQLFASPRRPVEGIAVRSLAVNLHAIIAKSACGFDQFRKSQGFAPIPGAEIGDAIESEFHFDQSAFLSCSWQPNGYCQDSGIIVLAVQTTVRHFQLLTVMVTTFDRCARRPPGQCWAA